MQNLLGQTLKILECTQSEKMVFEAIARYDAFHISGCARVLKIPRSTVHGYIKSLLQKGLLVEHVGNKGSMYSAISQEELMHLVTGVKKKIDGVVTNLQSTEDLFADADRRNNMKKKISYFEGEDALAVLYSRYIASEVNHTFFDLDAAMQKTGTDLQYFIDIGLQHTGQTYEIMFDTPNTREYAKYMPRETHVIKFITSDRPVFGDVMIFDTTYFYVGYSDVLFGMEVSDQTFLRTQRLLFEQLWRRL